MAVLSRRYRHNVGTKAQRMKLRGLFLGGIMIVLSLATFSTHPSVMETSAKVGASLPRSLFAAELLPETISGSRVLAADSQECHEILEAFCGDGSNDSSIPICLVDEAFEGACCQENSEAPGDFLASNNCLSVKDQTFCPADELCVAELLPGSGVGAQCLSGFEQDAGSVAYLLVLLYLFLGLAIVCDDYFSYALDMLGDLMGMSSDVKGATFAAIGSSAPELFVSLADNVIANPPKSVGVGTIVGSAIFNILVIIGASAVVAGQQHGHLKLNWRPLMRDSFFYSVSIVALIAVAVTGDEAENYEGAILVLLYGSYLLFMRYNQRIFDYVDKRLGYDTPKADTPKAEAVEDVKEVADVAVLDEQEEKAEGDDNEDGKDFARQDTATSRKRVNQGTLTSKKNLQRSRGGSFGSAIGKGKLEEDDVSGVPYFSVLYWPKYDPNEDIDDEAAANVPPPSFAQSYLGGGLRMWLKRIYFIFTFPINLVFRLTIPDARYDIFCEDRDGIKDARAKAYWAEFTMCIFHIALFSHFLVFSAAKFGCLVGIDPAVMGLTVLAAGTSVPDMITSVILTKNGEGDAAVANSIGSNVFDILIGLGLPWFLAGFIYGGSAVATGDIGIAIGFLFGVLIVLLVALQITKFTLNKYIGYGLLFLYVFYVLFELFIRPAFEKEEE